jgi:hypothetical protein
MSDPLKQWLAGCALVPGMIGCGIRFPNRECRSYSFTESFSRESIDQMLNSLAGTLNQFSDRNPPPRLLTWTFSKGHVRLIVRPDGVLFGCATASDSPNADNLKQVSEEFLTLQIPASASEHPDTLAKPAAPT